MKLLPLTGATDASISAYSNACVGVPIMEYLFFLGYS